MSNETLIPFDPEIAVKHPERARKQFMLMQSRLVTALAEIVRLRLRLGEDPYEPLSSTQNEVLTSPVDPTTAKTLELIDNKILHYDTQMEGADHDQFICADWAAGAMRQLKQEMLEMYAAQSVTASHQLTSPVEPAAERPTTLEEMREIFRGKP